MVVQKLWHLLKCESNCLAATPIAWQLHPLLVWGANIQSLFKLLFNQPTSSKQFLLLIYVHKTFPYTIILVLLFSSKIHFCRVTLFVNSFTCGNLPVEVRSIKFSVKKCSQLLTVIYPILTWWGGGPFRVKFAWLYF